VRVIHTFFLRTSDRSVDSVDEISLVVSSKFLVMEIPTRRKPTFIPTVDTEANRNWNDQQKWAVLCALVDQGPSMRDSLLREFANIDSTADQYNLTTSSNEKPAQSSRQTTLLSVSDAKIRLFRQKMNDRISYMVDNWRTDIWIRRALMPFFLMDSDQKLSTLFFFLFSN
jgi:hypothetical protein